MYATTKVSTKYQVVIPKEIRNVTKGVIPGATVKIMSISPSDIQISLSPKGSTWADKARGAAKGVYEKEYLENLRNEWQIRNKALNKK
ncbi:hypothetical protein A2982_02025 [candidate division WWE3 bacterium RIFCSPLOWO2_01_FULL_39_13]|uniref:SpoVT-AbrB domain-containing protein n=1 Tax=candidate division WWE3 bacterium RIFCSPLOWO2_01_FULL_39_13 TaxID=1802624 RepID=A0A1F4V350_UNCKA|nr:MAG: hypothetical protein A2982_02025 [candidate division WWE3 bacterium RIFCSPLOWO2_01_FULL_39_13]